MYNLRSFVGSLVCLMILAACENTPAPSNMDLAGVWEARVDRSTELNVHVSFIRVNDRISGTANGVEASSSIDGARFTLDFGPELGEFRGVIDTATADILGHWIQPTLQLRGFDRRATPVTLSQQNDGSYAADVKALEDALTFYLVVEKAEAETFSAALINPDGNLGRFFRNAELVETESSIQFWSDARGGDGRQMNFEGRVDPENDTLTLDMGRFGGTYNFKRANGQSHYYPRAVDTTYHYKAPQAAGDDIDVGAVESVGMDQDTLEEFINLLINHRAKDPNEAAIHSVLVARHGKLVLEEYFHGYTADMPHDLRSASKQITGLMAGLLSHAGVPVSLDDKLYELLSPNTPATELAEGKGDITLRHVLSMSTGLDCNDADWESPGGEDRMQEQSAQPDWFRYTLDLDLVHQPGTYAAYCSGGTNLAGGMYAARAGAWMPDLLYQYLAKPLGFGNYHVNLMPEANEAYSGGGIYLRPRDMLKIGQLMLDRGLWKGERLADAAFIDEAVTPLFELFGQGWGLGWPSTIYQVNGEAYPAYYAGGNGGQQVVVIPKLDLVVVSTGGAYSTRGTYTARDVYIPKYIIPAALANESE